MGPGIVMYNQGCVQDVIKSYKLTIFMLLRFNIIAIFIYIEFPCSISDLAMIMSLTVYVLQDCG